MKRKQKQKERRRNSPTTLCHHTMAISIPDFIFLSYIVYAKAGNLASPSPTPTPMKLYTNPVKGSQILVGTRDICSV